MSRNILKYTTHKEQHPKKETQETAKGNKIKKEKEKLI